MKKVTENTFTTFKKASIALNEAELVCSICDRSAGNWQQWWNRDQGYGICKSCVDNWKDSQMFGKPRFGPGEFDKTYGAAGINRPRGLNESINGDENKINEDSLGKYIFDFYYGSNLIATAIANTEDEAKAKIETQFSTFGPTIFGGANPIPYLNNGATAVKRERS